MKYDDFKIFKFSTISKNINLIKDSFSRIYKSINFKRYKYISVYVVDSIMSTIQYIFFGVYKSINFTRYQFLKIYKNTLYIVIMANELKNIFFIISFAPTDVAKILSLGNKGLGLTIINFLKLKFFIALAQAPIFSDNCGL